MNIELQGPTIEIQDTFDEEEVSFEGPSIECAEGLGFVAVCSACPLLRMFGDCPKAIREQAEDEPTGPDEELQVELIDFSKKPEELTEDEAGAHTDNDDAVTVVPVEQTSAGRYSEAKNTKVPSRESIAPLTRPHKKKPVTNSEPKNNVSASKNILTPERRERSFRELLFDDTVPVVVALPRSQKTVEAIAPVVPPERRNDTQPERGNHNLDEVVATTDEVIMATTAKEQDVQTEGQDIQERIQPNVVRSEEKTAKQEVSFEPAQVKSPVDAPIDLNSVAQGEAPKEADVVSDCESACAMAVQLALRAQEVDITEVCNHDNNEVAREGSTQGQISLSTVSGAIMYDYKPINAMATSEFIEESLTGIELSDTRLAQVIDSFTIPTPPDSEELATNHHHATTIPHTPERIFPRQSAPRLIAQSLTHFLGFIALITSQMAIDKTNQ